MNYNSVILVGVFAITAAWWLVHARRNYPGPKVMTLYIHEGRVVEAPLEAGGLNASSDDAPDPEKKTAKED